MREETGYSIVLEMIRDQRRIGARKLRFLIKDDIVELGLKIGRDRLFDLLRDAGLLVKRRKKYVSTTKSFMRYSQFGDLFNGKVWTSAHQAWVSDITYLRVGTSFKYLFLVTDAYSRKIVGWHLGSSLESKWAVEALKMAIGQCPHTPGLVHHSDRGFQYCSKVYTGMLKEAGISPSMGEAGNCYDNAMAERVNGILKIEYLLDRNFRTLKEAFAAVKQAVWTYNDKRPHMSLNMGKPSEVHQGLSVFSSLKRKGRPRQKPVKAI